MNTMKILAIGNSFSEDASEFIHQMAAAAGKDVDITNLYIGGCPLELHWQNIENDGKYNYQHNGIKSAWMISIPEALELCQWDVIVTQQASHDSGWICSYEPFLGLMIDYIRQKAPTAKLYLQETWAYEHGSTHGKFMRYQRNQQLMYDQLHACYSGMADKYQVGLIPSGTVIQKLRSVPEFDVLKGGISLCRDGFHMSFGYGRYTLACVWLKTLLGIELSAVEYMPESINLPESPDPEILHKIRCYVDSWL